MATGVTVAIVTYTNIHFMLILYNLSKFITEYLTCHKWIETFAEIGNVNSKCTL